MKQKTLSKCYLLLVPKHSVMAKTKTVTTRNKEGILGVPMHEDIISKEVPGGKVTPTGKRRKLCCIYQMHNKAC